MKSSHIRTSLPLKAYRLDFQPIVSACTFEPVKCEALLRRSKTNQMHPGQLIAFAEQTGTSWLLDAYVRKLAFKAEKRFKAINPEFRVSVNLSPLSLTPTLATEIEAELAEAQILPEDVVLEITETRPYEDLEVAKQCISDLRSLGCQVYLDDFNTRYSTLNYLPDLEVDGIKIDRSYVLMIGKPGYQQYLIDILARIGHGFKLKMVVEGIERREQLEKVQSLGIQEIQGFLFAYPMPEEKCLQWLADRNRQAA